MNGTYDKKRRTAVHNFLRDDPSNVGSLPFTRKKKLLKWKKVIVRSLDRRIFEDNGTVLQLFFLDTKTRKAKVVSTILRMSTENEVNLTAFIQLCENTFLRFIKGIETAQQFSSFRVKKR